MIVNDYVMLRVWWSRCRVAKHCSAADSALIHGPTCAAATGTGETEDSVLPWQQPVAAKAVLSCEGGDTREPNAAVSDAARLLSISTKSSSAACATATKPAPSSPSINSLPLESEESDVALLSYAAAA